jgi:aminotransferase
MAAMKKLHQFAVMSASTTAQIAGIAALRDADEAVEMMRLEYDKRRKILIDGFRRLGIEGRRKNFRAQPPRLGG